MDLSNSVIMPREDFLELQAVSSSQTPTTTSDRLATTAQTFAFFAILAGSVTAGSWGWAKAMDWYDSKKFDREIANAERVQTTK
jgi:hypothetical protein